MTEAAAAESKRAVSYFYDDSITVYSSVEANLLKPHILKLTDELVRAYELPQHMRMCACGAQWQPASALELNRFHTDPYVHFLQQLTCNAMLVADDSRNHALNQSVCFSESAWFYSTTYAGGAIAAANALTSNESDVAICLMGGQTHARRDCASGFSYVNDAVLAILQLLRVPAPDPQPERRVLFVNVDAHHCSGVEEAFFTTDRVCTVSVHRYGVTAFPGSGGIGDIGADAGKHHNINLPVADGLDDEGLASLLHPVLTAAVERFCPHCVVLCAGGSVLSGDRLGCLNVTLSGHRAYFKLLLDLDLPLLVLGGGGYTQLNTARAWTSLTAMACGASLDLDAPLPKGKTPGGLLEGYPADATLAVPVATMEDMNTEAALARIHKAAGDAMEVERTAAVAGAEGGGGGGGAVDVSMSEDQMQAQEPGLGDDA